MTFAWFHPVSVPAIHELLLSPGQPLDAATCDLMETRLGHDYSTVRPPSHLSDDHTALLRNQPGDAYEREAWSLAEKLLADLGSPEPSLARHDFHQVRIHTGPVADEAALALGARAFTVGEHIVFAAGCYAPRTAAGKLLLAHELTHVLQQRGGGSRLLQCAECDTAALPPTVTLNNCLGDINQKVNDTLTQVRKKGTTSSVVVSGLFEELGKGGWPTGKAPIESWANSLPSNEAYTPPTATTKYNGVTYGIWGQTSRQIGEFFNHPICAATLNVNGILIGTDKLGHFFQQGYDYFMMAKGKPPAVGDADAERYGRTTEGGIYGLKTTGVYSNADLAANRKGLQFYRELDASPSMAFDLARYIASDWNEEVNSNMYEDSVGRIVWSNVLSGGLWLTQTTESPALSESLQGAITIKFKFTVTGNVNLTGSFSHPDPRGGTITGTIRNGRITYRTTAAGSYTAISGIDITFDWQGGSHNGKGKLSSIDETTLDGSWGIDGSDSDSRLILTKK